MQVSHTPSLPPRGGSWVPGAHLLLSGLSGRQCDHAGGWFGLARTLSPGGTGCSHPYGKKQSFIVPSSPLIPSSLAGRSWDEPPARDSRRRSAPSPFLDVHQAQVSLTSIPASAPLVPGRAAPIPHFSFSDTVQGRQSKSQAWAMIHLRTYEHRFWGRTSARYGGQRGWGGFWGRTPARYGGQRGSRGSGAVVNRRIRQRRPVFNLPTLLPRDSIIFFFSARLTGPWHLLETVPGDVPRASGIKRIMLKPHLPLDRGSQNFAD